VLPRSGMKVRASVKKICEKCRVIRRRGQSHGDLFQPQSTNSARVRADQTASVRALKYGVKSHPKDSLKVYRQPQRSSLGRRLSVARIAGVDLPRDKRVEIGLTYVFGIGLSRAQTVIQAQTGVNPDTQRPGLERRGCRRNLRSFIESNYPSRRRFAALGSR
jgi:hypothetical protein